MTTINSIQFPYISIFDPNTLATAVPETPKLIENVTQSADRSKISFSALSRLREFDAANNRLATYLKPIDETETTLESIRSEIADLKTFAEQALTLKNAPPTAGSGGTSGTTASTTRPIEARTSAIISESTVVEGSAAGMRLSISSDNGEDFTFTFSDGPTTWGEVATQLNAAQIGVVARFDRSGTDGPRLVIESANGRTGFKINGTSSRQVVDDLVGISSPYDGGYDPAKFTNGGGAGPASGGLGPRGLTFGNGGSLVSLGAETQIAVGSSIRFAGSDGVQHRWTAAATTSLRSFMLDINAMRGSVVAEITTEGKLRLRDTQGGDVTIGTATGSFAPAGALRLQRDVAAPPPPGLPEDAVAARASAQIDRDTLVSGAQNGMRFSITTDSGQNFTYTFGMDAENVTWGQIADDLNAANIGVAIRFDENQIGSSRLSVYSVDGSSGFRIDGRSSRQVIDDLFGISSPYDGAFKPEMFANGFQLPAVGIDAKEHGMTFGRGAAIKALSPSRTITMGTSITFVDSDGIERHWAANGSGTSPITFIEEIKAMHSSVAAEFASDGSLRLRSLDGRDVKVIEATGDFDPAEGPLRFNAEVPPPANPVERSSDQQIASIGRILNARMTSLGAAMSNLAYTKGVAANELIAQSSALATATPWGEWSGSSASIQSTRDAVSTVADNIDQIIAQLTDRLGTLKAMEGSYRDLGTDLKNFAAEMLDHYLTWDEAKNMASQIQSKLSQTTAGMAPDQARDLLLLLG